MDKRLADVIGEVRELKQRVAALEKAVNVDRMPNQTSKLKKAQRYASLKIVVLGVLLVYEQNSVPLNGSQTHGGDWQFEMKVGDLAKKVVADERWAEGSLPAQTVGFVVRYLLGLPVSSRERAGFFIRWKAGDLKKCRL